MADSADPGRAADPPPAPISARRAYAEVLIVFALVFASAIVSAGETLGGTAKPVTGGWADYVPAIVQAVCQLVLISIVVVLMSARRGVTPRRFGLRLPRVWEGRAGEGSRPDASRAAWGRAVRMAALGMLALLVGGAVTGVASMGHHLPMPAHLSGPYLVYSLFTGALFSGVVEEMVALAFVVSTLKQANRPVAEIVIVGVLLRCTYHIYYGPGVVGIAIWAAAFILLYLRFRSVIPLIVLHVVWDASDFVLLKWQSLAIVAFIAILILFLTALALWLMDRADRPPQPPYAPLPPYPPPPGDGRS